MKSISLTKKMDALQLSDIYSLMLFILYKIQNIPEYAVTSELCYLLDGGNMTRLLTYFAGKTVTFPTEEEMSTVTSALLLYKYVSIDQITLPEALNKLDKMTKSQQDKIVNLYLQIIPIMNQYNIDRSFLKED